MRIKVSTEAMANSKGFRTNKNTKPILCITTGEVYASGMDMAEQLGLNGGCISQCCNGTRPHTKGYKMCFVDDAVKHIDDIVQSINTSKVEHDLVEQLKKEKAEVEKAKEIERLELLRKFEQQKFEDNLKLAQMYQEIANNCLEKVAELGREIENVNAK